MLRGGAARLVPYAAAGTLLVLLIDARQPAAAADVRSLLLIGGIVVFAAVTPRILATAAPLTFVVLIALTSASPLVRTRNFFGVVEVRETADYHAEYSGTTLHGLQYTDDRRDQPTTYYSRVGPLASVFEDLRARTSGAKIGPKVGPKVGVVGLGVGTIAAYAQPGDDLTFYEINPAVVDIARNPAYFTYVSDAPVIPRIVVGDGRLSLADQPAGSFDLLILDAFSSDTVPAHLLTREAIETYARTLRPGGVLAFHLSNRYYSLVGPVAATARAAGLDALTRGFTPNAAQIEQDGATGSRWLVAGRPEDLARFAADGWTAPTGGYTLTDDYSDLTRSLNLAGF
jgi:SAM-dependent methyltransferase